MCNHSINYVTARSRLFLLRTPSPKCATRWLSKLANPVCTAAVASSPSLPHSPSSRHPYRPGPVSPGLRHVPFSVRLPGNGKKTSTGSRRDRWRAYSRGRRAALRGTPPDKSRRSHVETTNSVRAPTPPPPPLLIELP